MSQAETIRQQLYDLRSQQEMEKRRLLDSIGIHRGYSDELMRLRSSIVMGRAGWDTPERRRREEWLVTELNRLDHTQSQCKRRIDMLDSQITLTEYRLRQAERS